MRHTAVPDSDEHWFEIGPADERIAYACVVQCRSFAWVEEIAVEPRHRGEELASHILDAIITAFGRQEIALGATPFVPDSWKPKRSGLDAVQLRAWYRRHGFHAMSDDSHLYRAADG
ncbi:GNAT family N-acetyltransferase (plasmid) [Streptomyces sp. R39]|uniref:GNAT family N-acetyltransferase n=1 Tax=Streptomyces sp. R39 TaxID=3238631 RepID=A0AB39R921_9ACTN